MAAHNDLGHRGEDLAAEYLQEQGYCILERNWTNRGRKELDIVATKDDVVVFVEVKTRKVGSATTPISAVNASKQHRVVLAADSYLKAHHIDFRCRFDVIGIIYNEYGSRIEHYEDAFKPRPRFYR
ncbi:MAG: YraN family protein [Bacteroidaceae bacterium]|nr:YraN family protein [Bacteroidaceae bacterium]